MIYEIKIASSDMEVVVPCEAEETVLEAVERSGFSMPYSCLKGVCSTCEGTLITGDVQTIGGGLVHGFSDAVRFCTVRPRSNLVIQPRKILKKITSAPKKLTASVFRITSLAKDVTCLELRLPMGKRSKFRAGQYLRINLEDGVSRNYSMANPPHKNDMLELHIRHIPGGRFSETVLTKIEKKVHLSIELPYGQFMLNENSESPIILIASGTGFAPIKSIIEDQLARGGERRMDLYWGGRSRDDLYLSEIAEVWSASVPWFTFIPVLSRPDRSWDGREGWVQHVVLADHPDLSSWEVYACGNPQMISESRAMLISKAGLNADNFYCDAFVATGSVDESNVSLDC
jgi:CDP-4-dehydro-6-deoxyglucose reductase/3-phenylpropionate/trans-cinnamate dioxygenase ferredoxin reductase subunit